MRTVFGTLSAIVMLLSAVVMGMTYMDQRYVEDIAKQVIAHKIEAEIVEKVPALGDPDSKTSAAFRKTFGRLAGQDGGEPQASDGDDAAESQASGAETMVAIIERVIEPVCLCVPATLDALQKPDSEAGRVARLRNKAVAGIRTLMAKVYQAKVEALLFKIRTIAGQMMAAGFLGLYLAVFGLKTDLRPRHYTALDVAMLPMTILSGLFFIGSWIFASFVLSIGGPILIVLNCLLLLVLLDAAFNDGSICGSILDL
ncbi:MAG: hypothetical protein Alpg2KO_11870 [Alphaproteobacteria bacterium]